MICEGYAEEDPFAQQGSPKKISSNDPKSTHKHLQGKEPGRALIGTNWALIGKLIPLIGK